MSEVLHRLVCSGCGYDGMKAGEPTGTIQASVTYFCPVCHSAMYRDDPLGEIEREAHGAVTFEEAFPDGPGIYPTHSRPACQEEA